MGRQGHTSAECACSEMSGLRKTDIGLAGPPARRSTPVCTFIRMDDDVPRSTFNVHNPPSTAQPVAVMSAWRGGSGS